MAKRVLAVLTLVLAAVLGPSMARAESAVDMVRTKQTALFALIAQPKSAARDAQIKSMFDGMLSYRELAQASLGDRWATLTDPQKDEFTSLLEQLVRSAYQKNLQKVVGYRMEYAGQAATGGEWRVMSRAVSQSNQREEPFEIEFQVKDVGGKWQVVDIIPEGASLVKTYRSQFTRILDKQGYAGLVQKMKDKINKGE